MSAGSAVPLVPDPGRLRGLRDALRAAEFTSDRVEATLGTHELSSRPADTAVHLRRLGDDAFSTLARLFLLDASVGAAVAAGAFGELGVDGAAALGLVRRDGGEVVARARLVPHGELWVASDGGPGDGLPAYDHVPGIQAPSVTLAKVAVRRPVPAALDLGTGCGIQALLAARHAERVVATDVNPRALTYAAFNASLNEVENVELREGAGFEPVAGERFGLIVSNPPYVLSPDSDYAYRDSGLVGDALCRALVEQAPSALEEGGFAHVLVSWAHERDGDPYVPLRAWVERRGCDAWLLHYKTEDPLTHAAGWLRPLADARPDEHPAALDRWVAYLERLGVDAVGYGAIVLRRRAAARNWVAEDTLPLDRLEPAGEHTLRVFAGHDVVDALRSDALLGEPLRLVPHRLRQTIVAHDGGFVVEEQTLELADGLRFQLGIDRHTASLLPHFDGERPLREVLGRASATFDLDAGERAGFVPAALPVVRRLLELGFLERAEPA